MNRVGLYAKVLQSGDAEKQEKTFRGKNNRARNPPVQPLNLEIAGPEEPRFSPSVGGNEASVAEGSTWSRSR